MTDKRSVRKRRFDSRPRAHGWWPGMYGTCSVRATPGACCVRLSGFRTLMATLARVLAPWLVVGLLSSAALAQTVCVRCSEPEQSYSCSLAPMAAAGAPRGRALQFRCVQEIARTYNHGRCRVKEADFGACSGQVHMVTGQPPAIPPAGAQPANKTAEVGGDASKPTRQEEPATVVELAKRAASDTQKELNRSAEKVSKTVAKAGKTVSKAAKSTWRCLSSFFSDC